MPDRRAPPPTDEGWYALHDFRTVDWDAWRDAPQRVRDRALTEAVEHLEDVESVADADEGASALYSVLGHDADLLLVHLRPTSAEIDALQRSFEGLELAGFTERATSYVSVTEASGYSERARSYFEGDLDPESGLARYIRSRLYPTVPDAEHVCFYPMDKRRDPDQNWYDLPFEERAEHMAAHGDIGRDYGGKVTQMITGSIGLDDWEWGVTLWADDLTDVKDLLYEMRFDPSTSQFAEFGSFYVGRRFHPADLEALLSGAVVPSGDGGAAVLTGKESPADQGVTSGEDGPTAAATSTPEAGQAGGESAPHARRESAPSAGSESSAGGDADERGGAHPGSAATGDHPHAGEDHGHPTDESVDESPTGGEGSSSAEGAAEDAPEGDHPDAGGGGRPDVSASIEEVDDVESRLTLLGLREEVDDDARYAVICYSEADAADLAEETEDLASNFDHYDRHVETKVRAHQGRAAAVSIWTAKEAAETAAGFMGDLPGVSRTLGGFVGDADAETGAEEAGAPDESAERGADEGTGDANATPGDETATAGQGPGDEAATAAHAPGDENEAGDVHEELADLDIYAGKPHGEDVYALVLYSTADPESLFEETTTLRETFEEYDSHVKTAVYENPEAEAAAVVSLWDSERAADRAGDHLAELPDVVGKPQDREGFGTMGMFYTVKPEHRDDFVEKFEEVGDVLADVDGHRETALLENREDENDMFIASRWDAREDAMGFFRSEAFAQTVDWGRDVLDDRPRHVFLA